MSYQDRKDIDRLYNLVWDNEANQLVLVSKAEFKALKDELYSNYYPVASIDNKFRNIDTSMIKVSDSFKDDFEDATGESASTLDDVLSYFLDQLTASS